MFEQIGIATGRCHFCTTWGRVAILEAPGQPKPYQVKGCEKCWRATYKAVDLLGKLRKATAKPPKKARTRTQSSATASPRPPKAEAVSSLVPVGND